MVKVKYYAVTRTGYAVGYDYDRKVPSWAAYKLTPESVNKRFERSNKFKEDLEIPVQYRSKLSDYKGSDYDRGHMAASATVDFTYKSMMESFLLTNMTPQLARLNRQGRFPREHLTSDGSVQLDFEKLLRQYMYRYIDNPILKKLLISA